MPKGDEKTTLTDIAIQNAPAASPGKRTYLWDANVDGLAVRITDKGARSFIFMRRLAGTQFLETLGRYGTKPGEMSLKEARTRARELIEQIGDGKNPLAEIREAKAAAKAAPPVDAPIAFTVQKGVELYQKRHIEAMNADGTPKMKPRSRAEALRPLKAILLAQWSERALDSISKSEILDALDAMVDKGNLVAANRALMNLRAFFNFMVKRGRLAINPCANIDPPGGDEKERERVLSAEEIRLTWEAMAECAYPIGSLAQFLLVVGQRRDEVASMRWLEITDIDGDNPTWTIPAERTKATREHVVPLSPLAVRILKSIPKRAVAFPTGKPAEMSEYVFTTNGKAPFSGFSGGKERLDQLVTKELNRRAAEAGEEMEPMEHWTLHDLRRTVITQMGEMEVPPHVLSRVLNHSVQEKEGITVKHYNHYDYLREKRHALESWATRLECIVAPVQNVISIHRSAK